MSDLGSSKSHSTCNTVYTHIWEFLVVFWGLEGAGDSISKIFTEEKKAKVIMLNQQSE